MTRLRSGFGAAPVACLALLLPSFATAQDTSGEAEPPPAPEESPAPAPPAEPVATAPPAEPVAPAPSAAETAAAERVAERADDDARQASGRGQKTDSVAFDPSLANTPQAPGPDDIRPSPVPWVVPNAQIQTWFTAFDQDEDAQADPGGYGDPEHDVGFNIPRVRFGVAGGWKLVDFAVRFGTTRPYDGVEVPPSTSVLLVDAWSRVSIRSKGGLTRFIVGQAPIAYSRESMMSSNDIVFQERAVSTNWLAPVRDIGASASHTYKWVTVNVGVFNGGGNLFGDVDPGVMFVSRLDVAAGGDAFRSNDSRDTIGFGAGYLHNKTFSTAENRVNVDFLGRIKGVTLFVEGGISFINPDDDPTILPPGVPEVTRRLGGLVQLSYFREVGVGAIEPAVRFSYYDDATHLKDNGDVGILHAGLNWREPVPFLDVGALYIHRIELQGRQTDNDSVRLFVGLRYPSRQFAPLDMVKLFRKAGTRPLDAPND